MKWKTSGAPVKVGVRMEAQARGQRGCYSIACPECGSVQGQPCVDASRAYVRAHQGRRQKWKTNMT